MLLIDSIESISSIQPKTLGDSKKKDKAMMQYDAVLVRITYHVWILVNCNIVS